MELFSDILLCGSVLAVFWGVGYYFHNRKLLLSLAEELFPGLPKRVEGRMKLFGVCSLDIVALIETEHGILELSFFGMGLSSKGMHLKFFMERNVSAELSVGKKSRLSTKGESVGLLKGDLEQYFNVYTETEASALQSLEKEELAQLLHEIRACDKKFYQLELKAGSVGSTAMIDTEKLSSGKALEERPGVTYRSARTLRTIDADMGDLQRVCQKLIALPKDL